MSGRVLWLLPWALGLCSCGGTGSPSAGSVDVETGLNFTNFSTEFYAAFAVRLAGTEDAFVRTPLLAPGASADLRALDVRGVGGPGGLDVQLNLYRRENADLPIGEDAGEAVVAAPVAAGAVADLPGCGVAPLAVYTIVNWDAAEGTARVKVAQGTPVEDAIRSSGRFGNVDAAWEFAGVDAAVAAGPPEPAELGAISGRVTSPEGEGVGGIGVLIRSRFRVRLDDGDAGNDPDAGYSAPIAVTFTDEDGRFGFQRPAGAYLVEVFADDVLFRPATVEVAAPIESIFIIAEPEL